MTNPLQQAIERSREVRVWCSSDITELCKFREALAIADAALANILDVAKRGSEPYKLISGPALGEYVNKVRAEMRKLFEEGQ